MRVAFFEYSLLNESLGLANLMGALKMRGHEYKLFIMTEEKDILSAVRKFNPDALCFTAVTGSQYHSFNLAQHLKKHMDVLTVLGGPHTTMFPEESIREDCVNIICRGEGEIPLTELLSAIEQGRNFSRIKNLWVKQNGKVIQNEIENLIQDLDSLPMPDRSQYLSYPIVRDLPLKRFITGYGCPYQCSFCRNAVFLKEIYKGKGNYLRRKSVDRVFKEIKEVKKIARTERIHFHDDNFNYQREWLEEFCNRYPKEIDIPFSCTVRVDIIDEPIVKMMHDAGCVGVTTGLETCSDKIRNEVLNKNLTNEDFIKASKLFRKYYIRHITAIMLNLPGEKFEDVFKTLDLLSELGVYSVRSGVFSVSKKQPIVKMLLESGYIKKVPEIDNFKPNKIEDVILQTSILKQLYRITPFINLMYKFHFLRPLWRIIVLLPTKRLRSLGRLLEGYLEMKFVGIPPVRGFRYYCRVKKGFHDHYNIR